MEEHHERDVFDLKREVTDISSLVKDIIAMSNIPGRNACIIIGIDNNFNYVGVTSHIKQNELQNEFTNMKTHGGIRPKIDVLPVNHKGYDLDIVLITHEYSGPVIPIGDDKRKKIKSDVIYSRYGEVNEEAKFGTMESLWFERFNKGLMSSSVLELYSEVVSTYFTLTTIVGRAFGIHGQNSIHSYQEELHIALNAFKIRCDNPLIFGDARIRKSVEIANNCVGSISASITYYAQDMQMGIATDSIGGWQEKLVKDYEELRDYVYSVVRNNNGFKLGIH